MSWSGTVTCSYCYRQGHNKRKCPELSERIKNEYESSVTMIEQARADGKEHDAEWYEDRAEKKRQEAKASTKRSRSDGSDNGDERTNANSKKSRTNDESGQHSTPTPTALVDQRMINANEKTNTGSSNTSGPSPMEIDVTQAGPPPATVSPTNELIQWVFR